MDSLAQFRLGRLKTKSQTLAHEAFKRILEAHLLVVFYGNVSLPNRLLIFFYECQKKCFQR